MRQIIPACALALCVAAVPLSAQSEATVTSKTKIKSDNGKVMTLKGCLAGGPSSFSLGANPYSVMPRDGVDLGSQVGHQVELTGVLIPAATKHDKDAKIEVKTETKVDPPKGADQKLEAKTKAKVARGDTAQFVVADVKVLSTTCTE